jgi:Fe-S cluster assembly scaffold protein SufB
LLNDKDFISNLKVFHTKPNLSSNIELKFVLYGKSKVELPVEITVNKGAINTSTNFHALVYLMDNEAKANITPSLFIHEKNIHKAGHGLVIKNIKPKDTIYFQSRGIDDDSAKKMLVDIC